MAKTRSPNYPRVGLKEAVSRVKMLYDQEGRNPTPREAMAVAIGYSGISGASDAVLAAMNKFGLIEKQGEDYIVSDLAMVIMYPQDEAEKREAIKEAALSPVLFRELYDHFGGRVPGNKNLEIYLLRNGFSKSAVGLTISAFGETMEYMASEEEEAADTAEKEKNSSSSFTPQATYKKEISKPEKGERLLLQVQVGKNSYCKLLAEGPFGKAELALLMDHLSIQLKLFEREEVWAGESGAMNSQTTTANGGVSEDQNDD
ncbi:MAG: hypothetical protein K9K66_18555 [Desulfarculaceae bacterium]|nr:hypothetical protein [Desulfarculaceae bacterium]MCF8072519.1 hypothetical protein [Desulfarculaceae bacterium]MCF8103660.1 hypothetical protein [Desulfarculaceae bacterium]MCF8117060.1 hypothetical protein [Desulfarculaceae bacterium]